MDRYFNASSALLLFWQLVAGFLSHVYLPIWFWACCHGLNSTTHPACPTTCILMLISSGILGSISWCVKCTHKRGQGPRTYYHRWSWSLVEMDDGKVKMLKRSCWVQGECHAAAATTIYSCTPLSFGWQSVWCRGWNSNLSRQISWRPARNMLGSWSTWIVVEGTCKTKSEPQKHKGHKVVISLCSYEWILHQQNQAHSWYTWIAGKVIAWAIACNLHLL